MSESLSCSSCGAPVASFWEVNGARRCEVCKDQALAAHGRPHGADLFRAAALGSLAALVSCAAYAALTLFTDRQFGYAAAALGAVIGGAVSNASRRRGGLRYQLLAVGLTYGAVAASYVPLAIRASRTTVAAEGTAAAQPGNALQQAAAMKAAPPELAAASPSADLASVASGPPQQMASPSARADAGRLVVVLAMLLVMSLTLPVHLAIASPFTLVFLVIALYMAARMNRAEPFAVRGPLEAAD